MNCPLLQSNSAATEPWKSASQNAPCVVIEPGKNFTADLEVWFMQKVINEMNVKWKWPGKRYTVIGALRVLDIYGDWGGWLLLDRNFLSVDVQLRGVWVRKMFRRAHTQLRESPGHFSTIQTGWIIHRRFPRNRTSSGFVTKWVQFICRCVWLYIIHLTLGMNQS